MRAKPQAKSSGGGAKASAAPPPTPPRTEGARQRQQASFGNRKSGYQPHASTSGDEPPVTNSNYARRPVPPPPEPEPQAAEAPKHHQVNTGSRVPDPLSQFRDNSDDRQRSPYVTKTGEKTNPFDASMGQAAQHEGKAPKGTTSDSSGKFFVKQSVQQSC